MLYDGHPLAVGSVVQKTFVDGVEYFDLAADRRRQAHIDDIKKRISGDEEEEPEAEDWPVELTKDEGYESVFEHRSYTGRSGTMFGYQGLGSVYWHMVSKLMLAAQ